MDSIKVLDKIYQGRISPFECQKPPELLNERLSMHLISPLADSFGVMPFVVKPVIRVLTRTG